MPQIRQTVPLSAELARLEGLPQPVVTFGRDLAKGESLPLHRHQRAQLVFAGSGVMTVSTLSAAYVVPPQRAVWMPGGIDHRIDARSDVTMRALYIDKDAAASLPREVCVIQVSSLLRELILAAVANGPDCAPETPQARLIAVIIDQLSASTVSNFALPMPRDPRLALVTQMIIDEPADPRSLKAWAREARTSERTLSRLFVSETGMSFRAWRQQRRLIRALELLGAGEKVTNIALELGYENTSAFIAMFRRSLGATPTQYLGKNN